MNSSKPAPLVVPETAVAPTSAEPASPAPAAAESAPKRVRRSAELFDVEGNRVYITLTCLCCKEVKPLASFGLRKMPNGSIRNQPWCRACRSSKRPETKTAPEAPETALQSPPEEEGL